MIDNNFNLLQFNKNEINDVLKIFITNSGFDILKHELKTDPCLLVINDGVRRFEIHYFLKNISNGGWSDSYSDVKRIQVGNVKKELVSTNKVRTHILFGIIKYKDKYIMVAWNSYRYISHATNRSCYIKDEYIKKCYEQGYILAKDYDQEIWLCDDKHFGYLIRDYISFNYIME